MQLPSNPEHRKNLVRRINEAVEEKLIIDGASSHIKSIKKDVKDQFEISAKDFDHLVKCFLDEQYPSELKAEAEEIGANYEILQGIKVDD